MKEETNICHALDCDKEVEAPKRKYCDNKCKQTVKYAVKMGRQCTVCQKQIKKPKPIVGGMDPVCFRKACRATHYGDES
jgi:hypothetical protein